MERIGVITESCRIEERRLSPLASVPFWRRVRFLLVMFGLISFFSGFAAGRVEAAGGSLQYVLECQLIGTSGSSTAPCVTVGVNRYKPVQVMAYVIDPAYQVAYEDWIAQQVSVDALVVYKPKLDALVAGASQLNWLVANQAPIQNVLNNQSTLTAQSFDPVVAGQFFGWGFTGLMLVGCAAWGAGSFIGFVSRVLGYSR